jgi:hypothetical protein
MYAKKEEGRQLAAFFFDINYLMSLFLFWILGLFCLLILGSKPISEVFETTPKFSSDLADAPRPKQENNYNKNDDPFCAA